MQERRGIGVVVNRDRYRRDILAMCLNPRYVQSGAWVLAILDPANGVKGHHLTSPHHIQRHTTALYDRHLITTPDTPLLLRWSIHTPTVVMALRSMWTRLRAGRAAFSTSASAAASASTKSKESLPPPPGRQTFTRQFVFRLLGLATWLPVAIWFNTTVAEVTRIEGPSMYPFLNSRFNESLERDWVLNRKLYAQEGLKRGMVVFLRCVLLFYLIQNITNCLLTE